jgi:hypothetical protein
VRIPKTAARIGALSLSLSDADGQPVQTRSIGQPEIKFEHELSRVTALCEYSDGRAIVLDAKERVVFLFDPRTKAAMRIGREGAGPGEYSRPNGLVSLPGDTVLVADGGNNRYLVLGRGGRVLGTMPLVKIQPTANTTYTVDISATDAHGRMYFLLPRGLVRQQEAGTPIVRFDRTSEKFDTVGRVFAPTLTTGQPRSAGGGASFGMVASTPYAARDEWAVRGGDDASVAIVRTEPYRVEWTSPSGATVRGARVAYDAVPIGSAEKEEWRAQARSRTGTLTTTTADGKTTQQQVPVPEPQSWPKTKPPFVGPAMIASNGTLWIERSRAARDATTSYDVFAANGSHAERVTMSGTRRVVGFGRGTVYVAYKDDDDLLHLERYRLAP